MNANRGIFWGTAIGTFLIGVGMAIAAVVYCVHVGDQAEASMRFDTTADHRIAAIESLVTDLRIDAKETRTNVSWIRQFLEHPQADHKAPPQTASVDP